MNRTQKQLRWISGGHFECEKAGLLIIGLLMPPEALSISGIFDKSSDSDCGIGMEPWIWQLPNGPDLLKLLICRPCGRCTANIIRPLYLRVISRKTATSPSPFTDFSTQLVLVVGVGGWSWEASEENKEREKWLICDLEMCQIRAQQLEILTQHLFFSILFFSDEKHAREIRENIPRSVDKRKKIRRKRKENKGRER